MRFHIENPLFLAVVAVVFFGCYFVTSSSCLYNSNNRYPLPSSSSSSSSSSSTTSSSLSFDYKSNIEKFFILKSKCCCQILQLIHLDGQNKCKNEKEKWSSNYVIPLFLLCSLSLSRLFFSYHIKPNKR